MKDHNEVYTATVLGDFISHLQFEDIPQQVLSRSKQFILDVIGCILAASNHEQAKLLIELIMEEGGNEHSSIFANGIKTSAMNSALAMGTMAHIYDYDDDHRSAGTHTSAAVFPAVFALAERLNANGEDFLKSYILGCEIAVRIGEAFYGEIFYSGFHATSVCGVFGSTAACCGLVASSPEQASNALGLAGSFTAGTMKWKTESTWQKPLQPGHAAMFGVLSASLANKGYIGAKSIFDDSDGFIEVHAYKKKYDFNKITDDLGKVWEFGNNSLKIHAGCRWAASSVDCAIELNRKGLTVEDIDKIIVGTNKIGIEVLTKPVGRKRYPKTTTEAQFSLPYMISAAFVYGRLGIDEFSNSSRRDPRIAAMIKKIDFILDDDAEFRYPDAFPVRFNVFSKSGSEFEIWKDYPKGDPENPASVAETKEKFSLLAGDSLTESVKNEVIGLIDGLETLDSIRILGDLLR